MVCVDSAPMHMAIALNTPVVAIFGPTNEKILVPQRENIKVMTAQNLACRPCLWEKRQTSCETKECLIIHTKDVFDNVEGLLEKCKKLAKYYPLIVLNTKSNFSSGAKASNTSQALP